MPKENRAKYVYKVERIALKDEEGQTVNRYCIMLADRDTEMPISCTGLEYYLHSSDTGMKFYASTNMLNRCLILITFLNWFLHYTQHDLCELDNNDIHGYLTYLKKTTSGDARTLSGWKKYRDTVYGWILSIKHSKPDFFKYLNTENLFVKKIVDGKKVKVYADSYVDTRSMRARETIRKNRMIGKGHIELLLACARMYDPELELAIMLQAYAGLREGEITNLTVGSINIDYTLGAVSIINIDLSHDAPWSIGTDNYSHIKRFRRQKVYLDFLEDVKTKYDEHINRHQINGDIADDVAIEEQPLFTWHGRPMKNRTYLSRLKRLFQNKFLPLLRRVCSDGDVYDENAAYIHAYEDDYPGAHALRHWYTMYLLTVAKMEREQTSIWRGDKSMKSIDTYIHDNYEMFELFEKSTIRFQNEIIQEIITR